LNTPSRRPLTSKPVTLQDIAESCGVSKMTVSLALRHDARISAATTARVQAAAEELGYDAAHQEAARRLALRKHGQEVINRLVAIIFPPNFIRARYFSDIFRGLLEVLTPEGFGLLTTGLDKLADIQSLPIVYNRGEVDGLVVYAAMTDQPLLTEMQMTRGLRQRPFVVLFGSFPHSMSVLTDDRLGAYQAAGHLLDLGHRQLLQFVFRDKEPRMDQRLDGIRTAMRERGIAPEMQLHQHELITGWMNPETLENYIDGDATTPPEQGKTLIEYLRAHPEITAVMGINDADAIHICHVLRQAGYRVPDDISVVGFDDTDPLPGAQGRNELTTVHLPLVEVGQTAARLLIAQVTGQPADSTQVTLPTSLIVRGSTGPAKR